MFLVIISIIMAVLNNSACQGQLQWVWGTTAVSS